MGTPLRMVAIVMAGALALAGPLAPLAAAQQPAQPGQPDLYKEAMKATTAQAAGPDERVYEVAATVTNVFLVPGRAITCMFGGAFGVLVLFATFGTGYKVAAAAAQEGCGGKWTITADDLRPADNWPVRETN